MSKAVAEAVERGIPELSQQGQFPEKSWMILTADALDWEAPTYPPQESVETRHGNGALTTEVLGWVPPRYPKGRSAARNLHPPVPIWDDAVGDERYPDRPEDRFDERDLDSKDILKRDFIAALEMDDLPSFFTLHPELAQIGHRLVVAERSRADRARLSEEERKAASSSSVARKRRQRANLTEEERAEQNAKRREAYRNAR